jgi:hypothetical protein
VRYQRRSGASGVASAGGVPQNATAAVGYPLQSAGGTTDGRKKIRLRGWGVKKKALLLQTRKKGKNSTKIGAIKTKRNK